MYSIKKVSELLDIPAVTIRAWENRYHAVTPMRTEGGHRLYSEADIETLKWIKHQTEGKNMKISEVVRLLQQKKPASRAIDHTKQPLHHREDLIDRLYQSFIHINGEQANEIIDFAFSLQNFEEVFHSILAPVLYRIGEQWEVGSVTVAQEHFASQLVLQRFHQFFRVLPVHYRYSRALAFCPEGEHHQIGLMLFGLFLRNKGVDVIYLGPNTPYAGLAELIELKSVSNVAVSISHSKYIPELEQWVNECLERFPDINFILGGNGLQPCPRSLQPFVLDAEHQAWEVWFQTTMR
ncbi:MerR family transcriptional regulator [Paenibacillus sp. sgz302251]|uniref:MerR family transcriptional regulator n=1 Tax=Paenibacillus sp. sgz302251 TaxID=3414493 RepID=UPI003C7C1F4F